MAYEPQMGGQPHGRQSPFRWDASSAASVLAVGALLFLIFVHFNVHAGASIGARR